MTFAIASKRGPKVEAVKKIIPSIINFLTTTSDPIEYLTHDVDGGIIMPRSLVELMNGARQRVYFLQKLLREQNEHADFFIGMEGGFHKVQFDDNELVFLQSWAFVSDGTDGFWGSSGNVLVPEKLAHEVMNNCRDLSEVIDEFANQIDIRSKQGTWGILTKDLLTRQQSFEIALSAAFAPFYNREFYK